jgi:hypothetical protein
MTAFTATMQPSSATALHHRPAAPGSSAAAPCVLTSMSIGMRRRGRIAARAEPPSPSSPSPSSPSTSSSSTTVIIAPPPPNAAAASVSTASPYRPGDPEVFPPAGLPSELEGEWHASVAAVQALLERAAAAEGASAAAAGGPTQRRRRGGGREEEDAPPELAAQRHVARAFGWTSQAYWRHSVVGAAVDSSRVERALAFLCGGEEAGEADSSGDTAPLGMSAPEAAAVLKSFPELLFLDADARLAANAAQLRRQWRLEGSVLRGALARNPRALGYDVDCQGSCVGDCHRCWARF